jgi:glycosyltransferase involved in cell wall biosynthesis
MTESDAPALSAIVLCYRAEEDALHVLEPLHRELNDEGIDFEMVLVANYWGDRQDRTADVARRFADDHAGVRVIAEPKRGAMGWDLRSGLAAARGDVLIVIDGDEQNPVEDVARMYGEMKRTGADVMKGRRVARYDPRLRHVISAVYNLVFRVVFRTRGLWDINGKPKGLTRAAYGRMDLTADDWFADAEIVLEARRLGLTIREMPVTFRKNRVRHSFVGGPAIPEFLRNIVRFRIRYWRRRGRD